MIDHPVATREEWLAARERLLEREKAHTRQGDELARQRRELPWVRIDEDYRFDTEEGEKTLPELFDGRSQLLLYHFMFGPSFEAGCPTCSSIADSIDGLLPHLRARDATLLLISSAPYEKLRAYRERMGWSVPWVSCAGSRFNLDLGFALPQEQTREMLAPMLAGGAPPIVEQISRATGTDPVSLLSERPGFSTFVLDDGAVYHAYSTTARGLEFVMGYYQILDRAPFGRDEDGGTAQLWLRRHDEYAEVTPAA